MRYEPDEAEGGVADPLPVSRPNEFFFAAWRRAFDFRGVASRMEYWSFVLVNLAIVVFLTAGAVLAGDGTAQYFGYAILVFSALAAIPYLSVSIRRFRDVTGTGWFTLTFPLLLYFPTTGSIIGMLLGTSGGGRGDVDTSAGYGGVWSKTPDWLSRSDRTEYWMFVLFTTLIFVGSFIVLAVSVSAIRISASPPGSGDYSDELLGVASIAVVIVFSAPVLPLLVRRVRDATGSGWVTLFLFPTSLVNPFLFFVITVWPSRDSERLGRLSGGYWDVWRKTADYVGVARRGEFWLFTLINSAVIFGGAGLVAALYYSQPDRSGTPIGLVLVPVILWALVASYFAWSIPWFSLAVRRVRDATGSGWWLLTCLIPVIGWIAVLVLFLLPTRNSTTSSPSGPQEEQIPSSDESARYEADDPWNTERIGTTSQ